MKNHVSSVDKEAAKWVEDCTPINTRVSSVDQEAAKWVEDSTPTNNIISSVDHHEAARPFSQPIPGEKLSASDNLKKITSNLKNNLAKKKPQTLQSK